jgi:hypothetical protein
VDYSDSEDEDNMIGLAEWVKGKKTISCPFDKSQRNSALISLRPIRYLICCFSKGRLNSPVPYYTIYKRVEEDEVLQVA